MRRKLRVYTKGRSLGNIAYSAFDVGAVSLWNTKTLPARVLHLIAPYTSLMPMLNL